MCKRYVELWKTKLVYFVNYHIVLKRADVYVNVIYTTGDTDVKISEKQYCFKTIEILFGVDFIYGIYWIYNSLNIIMTIIVSVICNKWLQ